VSLAVDHQRAGTADPFSAVVIEHDRFLTFLDKPFIQDVKHL
jgi:hypothetical protein